MIISVHLPKTAGTSFQATLEAHFGETLLKDYADLPINTPPEERNRAALENSVKNAMRDFAGIECIHGHFLPLKYVTVSARLDARFVAWMREPVDRVVSHYHFWRNFHDPSSAGRLHNQVVAEDWSLERFCLGPEVRNIYSQFLWGFPLSNFDFIGITEYYAEDLDWFARRYLGGPAVAASLNRAKPGAKVAEIDGALRRKIEEHHAEDVGLYQSGLARRAARK
ncbi:MAG TPA: sulfotransferase domain-containing protein [Chthoniobacteraceae bacterium]|nr:sulfotransferase domain-containing protein [Chthoniobacteraceae bacterium]